MDVHCVLLLLLSLALPLQSLALRGAMQQTRRSYLTERPFMQYVTSYFLHFDTMSTGSRFECGTSFVRDPSPKIAQRETHALARFFSFACNQSAMDWTVDALGSRSL
jgi:hypothetical protein